MAENVETAVYRLQIEGQAQLDKLVETVDGLAVQEDKATATIRVTSDALQNRIGRLDRLVGAQLEYAKTLQVIEAAQIKGVGTLEEINALLDLSTAKYQAQTEAINKAAAAQAVAAENARRLQEATGPGITVQRAGGTDAYAAQFEAAAKAQDEQVASISRLRSALNPLQELQGKLGAQMAVYRQALQDGKISQQEYAQAGEMAATKLGAFQAAEVGLTNAHKGLDTQGQAAFHSMRSFAEQMAMGVPITQALTTQMNHLTYAASGEGGIAGAFKQAGGMLMNMITPMRLVAAGAAGLGAGAVLAANQWNESQKAIDRALIGIGARTGTTAAQINDFAQKNASATGLSVSQMRTVGTEFAKTGAITVDTIGDVGTAVQGYEILTGKTATDATKDLAQALGGDLVKGANDLNKTYGFLNPAIEENIRVLQRQGDRAGATRIILAAIAGDNQRATDSLGPLTKAWNAVANAAIAAKDAIGAAVAAGPGAGETPGLAILPKGVDAATAAQQAKQMADLAKAGADAFEKESNRIEMAADAAAKSLIPEIAQIDKLKDQIADLERAKAQASGVGPLGPVPPTEFTNQAALDAAKQELQIAEQTKEAHARAVEEVNRIAAAHKGVSVTVAQQLDTMEKQTAVAGAVGGAEKMAAQYALDYANAKKAGATNAEAAALASAHEAETQAAINAAAKETLFSLQNQAAAAAAVTGAQQMAAQAAATFNSMVHQGVDAEIAAAVAAQQLANAHAAATAAVKNQIHSLEQSTELMIAQENGTEATVKAAQAYDNAIRSGADSTAAAALSAATLTNEMTRAAIAADKMAQAAAEAAQSAAMAAAKGNVWAPQNLDRWGIQNTTGGSMNIYPSALQPYGVVANTAMNEAILRASIAGSGGVTNPTNPSLTGSALADQYVQQGGVAYALAKLQGAAGSATGPDYSTIDTLFQLKQSQTSDKGQQATNIQQELAWLQSQPENLARDQSIVSLKQSLDQLTTSTNNLNSTNQDLLSPYYTQDPRTSHIGFRSQGMAAGGYIDVPGGSSANDNMLLTMPVASGERVYVDPMTGARGGGGTVVNLSISSPVIVQAGANTDQIGRTLYQSNQSLAKQIRAAMPS